jgi:hypothetical protein
VTNNLCSLCPEKRFIKSKKEKEFKRNMKIKSILVLLLLSAIPALAQDVTPGAKLNTELHKLQIDFASYATLTKGPDGEQWDEDELAHEAKLKEYNQRVAVHDSRTNTINTLSDAWNVSINQWGVDCDQQHHPDGLPQATVTACDGRRKEIEANRNVLQPQITVINAEKAQFDVEKAKFDADQAALTVRANKHNAALADLHLIYNPQLLIAQAAYKVFEDCKKVTPADCGTVPDYTVEQAAKVLTYVPQATGTAPGLYQGTWKGNWTGDGFVYTLVMSLDWGVQQTVQGQILWTLTSVPAGDKNDAYRAKVGQTAIEYVRGTSGQFAGYSKNDAQGIIALDTYRLAVSKDSMTGTTWNNGSDGGWKGIFTATRQ